MYPLPFLTFKIIPSIFIPHPWPIKWERQPTLFSTEHGLCFSWQGIYPEQAQNVMILQVFICISTWVVSTQVREVAESLGRFSEYLKARFHLAVLWRRKLQAFQRSRSFRPLVFPLQTSFHILHPPLLKSPHQRVITMPFKMVVVWGKIPGSPTSKNDQQSCELLLLPGEFSLPEA